MTRIILYELLRVVILNLLYTSVYSDGGRLYPEFNPLVGRPFKLVCNTEAIITNVVTIRFPNGIRAGYCDPPSSVTPVDCTGSTNYTSALNETETTVTISTNSLASDVNGIWRCSYLTDRFSYNLVAPIREIKDETFTLFPTSFTDNITSETTSISLSATYGCTNLPVYFKWIVVDSASNKIDIKGPNNTVENASVCTSLSGFNGYTEIKEVNEEVYSSNYVQDLDGSYRLGVEVHYTDEVTTHHSIKYFDTYFVFTPSTTPGSGGTNTPTDNEGIVFVILFVCLLANYSMVGAVCFCTRYTANKFKKRFFDCCGSKSSLESEGDPDLFKDKVLTLNSLLGFTCLVFYGVTVEVTVLLPVYYAYSKFQEGLVIGVGFVIVLVLSGLCLLVVVWMLMKFVNNDASETSRSQSLLKNATVTPRQTGKSQKKSTFDKRQQPDGHEGPQSTSEDPNSRHLATTRPLPPRPNIAAPQTGPFDSVNSPRPISLAPIENPNNPSLIDTLDEQETDKKPKDKKRKKKKKKKDEEHDNPADEQDNNVLTSLKDTIKSKDM